MSDSIVFQFVGDTAIMNTDNRIIEVKKEPAAIELLESRRLRRISSKKIYEEKTLPNNNGLLNRFYRQNRRRLRRLVYLILVLIYLVYFGYCLYFRFGDEGSWRLAVCTVFAILMILWKVLKRTQARRLKPKFPIPSQCVPVSNTKAKRIVRWSVFILFTICG